MRPYLVLVWKPAGRAPTPGVWLIDPERERVDFYRLDAEGYYERAPVDAEGAYHSEVIPGFCLKVEWLWQEPLPKVLDVLREMELI
jgi:Uma2 family endonuclease